MTEQLILVEHTGKVCRLTLNRPEKLNAINTPMLDELFAAVDQVLADDDTSVIVIAGAGRAFCAGWDTKSFGEPPANASADAAQTRASVDRWLTLWDAPKPVIAEVHGYCLGMANDLLACCDIVVCGEGAGIGMPEARDAALPPTLGFWPLRIGLARTKELLWTGALLDGAAAVEAGLASRVVPDADLRTAVDNLAQAIATVRPSALAVTKQAANAWWETIGVRAAARRGADYHAIYHESRSPR
jgi:enoyl-CoA hydratase